MSVSKYQKYFDKCINFNQNNKYHNLTLDKHIECAVNRAKALGYSDTIIEALKWHDFGKLFCATTDENGTHYIGHPQVSADIYKESNDNEYVYNLIKLHNVPITTKLINKYGFEFCKDLMRVKECDDFAHNDYAKQNTRNVKEKQREQVVMKKAERAYKIDKRLKSDFDYLQSLGYEVVCVCLQGSQNYNLDTDKSDIDTKAIVLPKFSDFIDNAKAVSTTIVLPSTEHIDVKDIRVMFDTLRKSNVNFLEILFTKYKILNKKYSKLIAPIFANAEKLAMSDKKALINCCYGMSMQKYVALKHPYPTIKDKIDKYGYDPKQLHHIIRMNLFLKDIVNGKTFKSSLIPQNIAYLISVKYGIHPLETAERLAKELIEETFNIKAKALNENNFVVDTETQNIYNKVKKDVLTQWFREELNKVEV